VSLALINIGDSHDGGPEGAIIHGDAILVDAGVITWIGGTDEVTAAEHETVIDVAGATVTPGFIDSHVHTTFGDYTPRQQTVGFLESYLHGGTTRVISASEVHVPGRPTSVVGVKSLAIAAAQSYAHYRPSGMTVHGGSVILEPGLTAQDFVELRENGVWLAKAGFGAFASPMDYVPIVQAARSAGITVMCHTGGGSIPGSLSKIDVDALLAMQPDIAGHVNGGPTALSEEENTRIVEEGGDIALQIVHAGNLRSAIDIAEKALVHGSFYRLLIATDTPTGTGMIPLGMLRQMAEMASLGPLSARQTLSASTGNVAVRYGLNAGRLAVGAPADLAILDAPLGSTARDAFAALEKGDLPAVASVVTDGVVRFTKSRNTPGPIRPVSFKSQ
jgi:enamidase